MYYHTSDWSLYPSIRISYNENGKEEYIGNAPVGSAEDAPVWFIRKMEYDSLDRLISVKFAEGEKKGSLENIFRWDLATTYTYS